MKSNFRIESVTLLFRLHSPTTTMSSIKYDSELMTNYVSALPVPPSSHYVTCIDPSSRRPMVFTISLDAKLLAVKVRASHPFRETNAKFSSRKTVMARIYSLISVKLWESLLQRLFKRLIVRKLLISRSIFALRYLLVLPLPTLSSPHRSTCPLPQRSVPCQAMP